MSKARVDTIANLNDDVQVDVALMVNRIYSNLGSKTAAPTVRNNGTPLVVGDTYFNTTTQADMTYFSSGWVKSLSATDVEDNLASVSALKVLSAKQGKILADAIVLANQSISNTYTKTEVDLIRTNLETLAKNSAAPVGSIEAWSFSRATLPAGRIARDGQLLNRADWPDLWTLVSPFAVTDAVWLAAPYDQRGKYSSGNGTTTFRMPDTNGKHADGNTIAAMTLRGDGKNSAGTPGLHQADQMQNVTGQFGQNLTGVLSSVPANTSGVFQVITPSSKSYPAPAGSGAADGANLVSFDLSRVARAGIETRGSNEAVIWCTVGAKTAVNTGTVDVTALATTVSSQASQIQSLQTSKVDATSMAIPRAVGSFIGNTSPSITRGTGFASITRASTGQFTITLTEARPNAIALVTANTNPSGSVTLIVTQSSSTTLQLLAYSGGAFVDIGLFSLSIY